MSSEKPPNKTLVFFKIRTSKLIGPTDPITTEPFHRKDIVEACFLAVKREDVESATVTDMPEQDRLSVLVIPWFRREPVLDEETQVPTGEYVDTPVNQEGLNKINDFLSALQPPICFVAHNGVRVDFKILVAECPDVLTTPENLRHVDTMTAFKYIEQALSVATTPAVDAIIQGIGQITVSETTNEETRRYKFRVMYQRLLNKTPPASKTAETKCRMLLECVVKKKDQFLTYADNKFLLLNGVKPLNFI